MNTPTKNLKAKIQPNEGEAEDSVPYQNKNKVAQTSVGFLPNLSATIPQEGAPNIIPENGIKLVFDIIKIWIRFLIAKTKYISSHSITTK